MIRMRAEATFLFEFGLKIVGGGLPFRERGRCRAGPQFYFRFWAVSVQSAACDAVAEGRKVGGSRKAPSVSTWPIIPDKSLRVGRLVDTGWDLQLSGE